MADELPIKTHHYREGYFPIGLKVFGLCLGIFGMALTYYENLAGLIPMFICIAMLVSYHGHFFDLEKKLYRHYFEFFGLKFGKWQKVESPKGVIFSKERDNQKLQSRTGATFKSKVSYWYVTLWTADGEELFIQQTENIKEACSIALLFLAVFKVPAYSKYPAKHRMLNYQLLRKGKIAFGDTLITR